jgi:hypothetical protein
MNMVRTAYSTGLRVVARPPLGGFLVAYFIRGVTIQKKLLNIAVPS